MTDRPPATDRDPAAGARPASSSIPARDLAREDLCRFLAACYYEPAPEFVEDKLFESMAAAAQRIDGDLAAGARRLGDAFVAQDLQELLIDYTRLFLGPIEAPARPYGSLWLSPDKELMQDSTLALMDLYREGGFELAEDFRDLPDHIAAELEFLYVLIFRENRARRDRDAGALAEVSSLRDRLIDGHLVRWVAPFTDAMERGAQTDFYRALARLTRAFVHRESSMAPRADTAQ